jgi:hypothetical protein
MRGLTLTVVFLVAVPAGAYIEALYPLAQFISESQVIVEGTIEKVDEKTKTCFIKVGKCLKGRCGYETIRVSVGGGQEWHPEVVMRHLKVGAPTVMFYNAERRAEIYLNRFFCQVYGDATQPADKAWWNFTHVEIYCNRTFVGTPEELSRTVADVLAGKAKAPPPDPKLPAITPVHLRSLAPWGAPAEKLPPSFARTEPARAPKPRDPENPPSIIPGLVCEVFEGTWSALPDFDALKPVSTGIASVFDLSKRPGEQHFGLRLRGYLDVPRDGTYVFTTVSDDGSKLLLGKTEVVSNDGRQGRTEKAGEVALRKGQHAITVTYFQKEGGQVLEVFWEGPELAKQKISASSLSH